MGVVQKVRGVHTLVLHQAQQRGAVAVPMAVAQGLGLGAHVAQVLLDVVAHGVTYLRHRRRVGIVQGVVQVEEPDAAGRVWAGFRTAQAASCAARAR